MILLPNCTTTTAPNDEHRLYCLTIRSWNLNKSYDTNFSHPNFSKFFDTVDVFFIQETHCYKHDNIPVPDGFVTYTRSCCHSDFKSPWGGVATLVCSSSACVRDDFSGPDLLTIEVMPYLNIHYFEWTANPCNGVATIVFPSVYIIQSVYHTSPNSF
ncbi:hypothetical protein D9758_016239 [Tetrapyrgos nigripes]|uniref:Endonuclease/exonuclease/phosphatase domain-containing protein n=1 Tax=Tetrapyrgos nigripes TaxID=182062 RepID=A0A8H5C4X0_9AGAR|nr:hypothetical protein D9758_016239 [Tetrapyrgos nigripes]